MACSLVLSAILGGFVVVGLLITTWRIYFRLKIGRFWWEDAWATVALFTGIVWLSVEWIDAHHDTRIQVTKAWIYSIMVTSLIMSVRMSLLFSIIRLASKGSAFLRVTLYFAAFFISSWVALIILKAWQCSLSFSYPMGDGEPYCIPMAQPAIVEVVTDLVSIAILVILPLCMLWNVKLPSRQRRMILAIFASSTVLAIASLFHAIGQRCLDFLIMTAALNIEVVLSLFICNLLVVVTFMSRYVIPGHVSSGNIPADTDSTDDDDDFTQPTRLIQGSTIMSLTTIDLESDAISMCESNRATALDHSCHDH